MADNILTYVLSLQDNLSDKLKKIGINNEQQLDTWARVQKQVNGANQTMQNMGKSIGSLNQRIAALRAQREWIPASNREAIRATNHEIQRLEREARKLETLDGGVMKKWFKEIKAGIPALVNPVSVAMVSIGKSIRLGMEEQLQRQNITTLMGGDKAGADTLFGKIADYGKNTVYDKAGLIEAQKTMMSFGIQGEKAFGVLKQIGDISMGDSQKMQSLALAFSQATSAGKLQGQDLMQMINAGFNPLNEISKHTGKSMSQLKDEMSKGKISADDLAQAFRWATEEGGMFYQGAEKAGQTFAGKWGQMKDSFSELGVSVFNVLEPMLSLLLKVANVVGDVLTRAVKAGWPLWIGAAVVSAFAVKKVKKEIGGVMTRLGGTSIAAVGTGGAFKVMGAMAKSACRGITVAISSIPIIGWIAGAITLIIGLFSLLWNRCAAFRGFFVGIWEVIKNTVGNAWQMLKGLIAKARAKLQEWWSKVVEKVHAAIAWVKGVIATVAGWFKRVMQPVWDWFGNLWGHVKEIFGKVVEWMAKVFNPIIELWNKLTKGNVEKFKSGYDKGAAAVRGKGAEETLVESVNGVGTEGVDTDDGKRGKYGKTESVATGGSRSTSIIINLKSLVEKIVFDGSYTENRGDMQRQVAEDLLQVLNMAQASVG